MTALFTVFRAGDGVPEDAGDFDPALAPPIGDYEEVKQLLAASFPGIEWDDDAAAGVLESPVGQIDFQCSGEILGTNVFFLSASADDPDELIAFIAPRLAAAGLAALDGETLEFIGVG